MEKYKKLRNKVNSQIRKDNIYYNNERIKKANDENEIWKVAKEITNPRNVSSWSMLNGKEEEIDEQIIADTFNNHFINKIRNLKEKNDPKDDEDPLERLSKKLANLRTTFNLKQVSSETLSIAFKKIKKKKSSGSDSLTQEQLAYGENVLITPLLAIFNTSLASGKFPTNWKTAIITPVLKKGNKNEYDNYRPVSCLPAAAKLLESIVCSQVTDYMEKNNFIPDTQHGFRKNRSTMTAWQQIQQDWAMQTEKKMTTGVLMWDLTAAFDTLDHEILLSKLKIYGFGEKAVLWIRTYLTGRTQRVKIGSKLSKIVEIQSGVPQGGNFSPLAVVIYVSDLEDWLQYASSLTYADDTSTSVSGKSINDVLRKLQIDAKNVLKFMSSNGLFANPSKTNFIVINDKEDGAGEREVQVGNAKVKQEKSAKLLGITIDENLRWNTQIYGKNGTIPSLNARTFIVKRIANHVGKESIKKIVDSLYTSKLRYGLTLFGQVKWNDTDVQEKWLTDLQLNQNKMLRYMNGSKISDRIKTKTILNKFDNLSVNQLNAQMKLVEMWKANNCLNYPIKTKKMETNEERSTTRAVSAGKLVEYGTSQKAKSTCYNDGVKVWNRAPNTIKNCKSIWAAKKAIKSFVKTLPL